MPQQSALPRNIWQRILTWRGSRRSSTWKLVGVMHRSPSDADEADFTRMQCRRSSMVGSRRFNLVALAGFTSVVTNCSYTIRCAGIGDLRGVRSSPYAREVAGSHPAGQYARVRGNRSGQRSATGLPDQAGVDAMLCFSRGSRCLHGLRSPGVYSERKESRASHCQYCRRPALVAVLLLRGRGASGIDLKKSGCDEACSTGLAEGDGSLCQESATRRAPGCRQWIRAPLRRSAQAAQRAPLCRWRDSNPEDTVRFHALRLHEARIIRSTPQKIIARGTNWRFLNELKKELKA